MKNDLWGIGIDHAYAPGSAPLLSLDTLGPLGALVQSGAGVVVAVGVTLVLAKVMDHLFSPPLQRPLGPRRR